MFNAKICCFFVKVQENVLSGLVSTFSLQPKKLQADYMSSYDWIFRIRVLQ